MKDAFKINKHSVIIIMKPTLPKQPKEIICACTGTTKEKVKILIDNGKGSLDDIASATGATTGCGACDFLIIKLLEEYPFSDNNTFAKKDSTMKGMKK